MARAVETAGRRLLRAAGAEVEEQELRRLRRRVQQVKVRPLDMLTRFSWVRCRQAGAKVVEEEDDRQDAVFGCGEQPASDLGVREIVVTTPSAVRQGPQVPGQARIIASTGSPLSDRSADRRELGWLATPTAPSNCGAYW